MTSFLNMDILSDEYSLFLYFSYYLADDYSFYDYKHLCSSLDSWIIINYKIFDIIDELPDTYDKYSCLFCDHPHEYTSPDAVRKHIRKQHSGIFKTIGKKPKNYCFKIN